MRRLAVMLVAGLLVAACGASPSPASSQSGNPSPAPAQSGNPSPGQIVGPVILDTQTTSATVAVGRMVVFKVDHPETWEITASPAGVVQVQKGYTDGSATFNPGALAVAAGTATVSLSNPAGEKLVFTVTVQ